MLSSLLTIVPLLLSAHVVTALPQLEKRYNVQVINNCYQSGQAALTFDDGPYLYEDDIARELGDSKGTFFLNGNNYDCIYNHVDTIRSLHAAGHTLGSHTWSHADLTKLSYNQIHDELAKVEDAFIKILGLKPIYFRPPYGSYNDLVLQVLDERGYKKLFLWSEDTGDANGESVGYSENVYNGVLSSYPSPHMVLDHSTIQTTSTQVMPYAIPKLKAKGYNLVAVDTCLGSSGEWPYQYIGQPGTPDGSWHC